MTTIAVRDGVMACDSLITGGMSAAATKMHRKGGVIVGFAGDWLAGEYFAQQYLSGENGSKKRDSDDDVELLVLKPSGIYLVDYRFREVKIASKYYAIGSGAPLAMVAMNMGATAADAVREAIVVDDYSGGRIRTLRLSVEEDDA